MGGSKRLVGVGYLFRQFSLSLHFIKFKVAFSFVHYVANKMVEAKVPKPAEAVPAKKKPDSMLERNVPSSTRARDTKLLLATRLRNPRSARSGVKSPALMEAPELFGPSSPPTSPPLLWDTVFAL